MKTILITFSFLLIGSLSIAQDDAYKLLLKRSSVSIHKAQKHMIAAKKPDAGGKLAQAVLLQTYAIQLYRQKKEAESACAGLEARKLAWDIIKEISNREDAYATATDEEKKLSANCGSADQMKQAGKKSVKNSSENDSDFSDPKSLNDSNIDIK